MADHVPLELLVVGTGRSGTQRAAKLLTDAGLPCSHERVFTPHGIRPAEHPAEASWLAVPELERYAGRPELTFRRGIVLTYREPELVVGSFVGLEFFTADRHRPYRDFALERVPDLRQVLELRGPRAAAEHWFRWFNLAGLRHAHLVMHVARVPHLELAELAGLDPGQLASLDTRLVRVGSRRSQRRQIARTELEAATVDVWHRLEEAAHG